MLWRLEARIIGDKTLVADVPSNLRSILLADCKGISNIVYQIRHTNCIQPYASNRHQIG